MADIRFGKGKPKDERTRNWTIIVYEDSAPKNWREILRGLHIQVFISPYHDRDVRASGEPKKPHWHVVLCFKGKKSIQQIQAISDQLSGTRVIWEECAVGDLDGMVRYLIHFDDALFVQGLMSYGRLQEPVSPQEGRILGNAALTGGSPHGDPINQGLSVIPPTICLVQPGQGRAR